MKGFGLALLVAAVAACYGFGISLFGQLAPDMRQTLGFGYEFVGNVSAGVQFATLFGLVAAWLTPRVGAAVVVLSATTVSGAGLLAVAATQNTAVLAAALLVMGGSAAAVFVPMLDLISRLLPPERRGFGLSLTSSGTAYGVIVGAALVPAFAGDGGEGWRTVWAICGAFTLLCAAMSSLVFRRLGLFAPAAAAIARLPAGRPRLPPGTLTWVLIVWTLSALNGFSTYPFQNFLSGYLREELGFSIGYAGLVWGTIGVGGMVSGIVVGALSQNGRVRLAILFCYAALTGAGLALTLAPVGLVPVLSGALFALGFYPVFGLLPAYASLQVDVQAATLIFGVCNVVQGLGGAAGNPLGVAARAATGSFSAIYLAFTAVAAIAFLLALALPRRR